MTDPRCTILSTHQGAGHFEFSSEKNWGVEQDDCKIFDSIDLTHLADSVASVPFNERYCIPVDLYTVEQLEEFEVEASLALSRHTFQFNTEFKKKIPASTSVSCSQTPETNKLLNLILGNLSCSEETNDLDSEIQSNGQLNSILGNMKPLINVLQDEANTISKINETNSQILEKQKESVKMIADIEVTNHDVGHWLDSMLDDSD